MKKIIWCFIFALTLIVPQMIVAQEVQKVAIAPYAVSGQGIKLEQLSNIRQGLLDLTVKGFSNQGFIPLALSESAASGGETAMKAQANQLGADYLFVPSLTKVGDRFNLTGVLISLTSKGKSSNRITVTSNSSENLPLTAERLVILSTDHLFGGGVPIVSVKIIGSDLLEDKAISNTLRTRVGSGYNDAKVSSDIKKIHSMGYFDDVKVEASKVSGGMAVTFIVKEKPQVSAISFKGNKLLDKDDLLKIITVKVYDLAGESKINESIDKIKKLYTDKGYPNVEVSYHLESDGERRAVLIFDISEGNKRYIKDIEFEGNDFYSSWTLSRQIKSSTRGIFSWLLGSGKLDQSKLSADAQLLEDFYQNNGFLQARVGEPLIEYTEDGNGIIVVFPIDEGTRFKVGEVTIGGNLLDTDDPQKMLKRVRIRDEKYFNRKVIQEDLNRIKTYYADQGYANNQVEPELLEPDEENRLSVVFHVNPGNLVSYDRITIVGNEKTRDKVIRRQLEVAEGDLTSASKLEDSSDYLMQSGYFEDVNFSPSPSDMPDKMNLRVEVKERPTGTFQIGAGYSSYNNVFGMAKITQQNLFGYGRSLEFDVNIGKKTDYYRFAFSDPWVGDIPLTVGFELFNYVTRYDFYRKESRGASIRSGYPIWGQFYLSGSYTWEDVSIKNVYDNYAEALRNMRGKSINSIASISLRRDTRNHFFQPTRGSSLRTTYAIASSFLNGDTAFQRYEFEAAKWIPVPYWRGASLMGHAQIGYMTEDKPGGLPVYEKYMLGGINSVRGYKWYEISPKDSDTGQAIGGEKMLQFNFELAFPLLDESGLFGVVFYDMGNVWKKNEPYKLKDMRKSYGGGLRYMSPFGPLRIEYGRAMDRAPGDPRGQFEFTMGSMF